MKYFDPSTLADSPGLMLRAKPALRTTPDLRSLQARYDTAQTNDNNRKLWAAADGLSADEANNPAVRAILRNRARYVYANNSRVKGMAESLAHYTVGVGPILKMTLGDGNRAKKLSSEIEYSLSRWARETRHAAKLRQMRIARVFDGESFLFWFINPKLRHPVKLDCVVIDTSRIASTYANYASGISVGTNPGGPFNRLEVRASLGDVTGGLTNYDGVWVDGFNNAVGYELMKPDGDTQFVSADRMDHYYLDNRGAHRGVPDITPAVQVIEEGRRFRAAVVGAAESAAEHAIVIESQIPPGSEDAAAALDPMDTFELSYRMATTLPRGWKMNAFKSEQPVTTYNEFSREIVMEAARCLHLPLNIALMFTSNNMSSAYGDTQSFGVAVEVDRDDLMPTIDAGIARWFNFAAAAGILGARPIATADLTYEFVWPSLNKHADPNKVANAQDTRLKNNTTTLAAEYAAGGKDWETELEQRARELKRIKELERANDIVMAEPVTVPALPGDPAKAAPGQNNNSLAKSPTNSIGLEDNAEDGPEESDDED